MSDKKTLEAYAERAEEYRSCFGHGTIPGRVKRFIGALPKSGRVLDIGCGPGAEAAAMANAGLIVDAMDAVPEMVAMASEHPGVNVRLARFDDITGDALYDGIWANFSLLHAPRAEMPGHLIAIKRALKPGGVFEIALKSGTGEKRDRLGRMYTYYTEAELDGLLATAGFTVTARAKGKERGLDGSEAEWIALTAHG